MTSSEQMTSLLKLSLAMLIIGSFVVVNKVISLSFPILLASGLRLLIGAIILNLWFWMKERELPKLSRKDFLVIFSQSFIGVFLFSFFMLYGLKFTSAVESGIITSITPAIIGIISFLFFKERLVKNQIVGIALALLGTLIINVAGILSNSGGTSSLFGNMLIFLAVIGEAVFITFGKLTSDKVTPLASAAWTCTIGFLLFLPFSIYQALDVTVWNSSYLIWANILYTGVFVTVIAVLLLNQAMAKISAGTSAVFSALMPVSAVILSYVFLQEPIHWYHFVGILIVLLGIFTIALAKKETHTLKESAPLEM